MKEVSINDLENDTWYWYTVHSEGDVFHPVFIQGNGILIMDAKEYSIGSFKGLTFYKAIMPNDNSQAVEAISNWANGFNSINESQDAVIADANDYCEQLNKPNYGWCDES